MSLYLACSLLSYKGRCLASMGMVISFCVNFRAGPGIKIDRMIKVRLGNPSRDLTL